MTQTTQSKVFSDMDSCGMILPGDTVIAGVSGGADSVAMLALLVRYQSRVRFRLEVLHVHHQIRGEEADQDEEFVRMLCRKWSVPFSSRHADVPGLSVQWKMGEEEAGRLVRRQAFDEAAAGLGDKGKVKIALAHHRNDVAETMLFHLCRGTGIRGLASIRPVQGNRIRPLLSLRRGEIEEFLAAEGIPYRTDSSNLCQDYTRNRIRGGILPLLEQYVNPQTVDHMAEASRRLWEAEDYLRETGKRRLKEYGRRENGIWLLENGLSALPGVESSYAVREALEDLAGRSKDFQSCHIDQIIALFGKQNSRRICLPYGLEAVRVYEGIELLSRPGGEQKEEFCVPLLVPGTAQIPGGKIKAALFPYSGQQISEKKYTKWFDYDKIQGILCCRTRRSGDYLPLSPKGPDKLLRRYFIDSRIPSGERDTIPLIAADSHVIWLVGGRISGRCKVSPDTTMVLELTYITPGGDKG